MQWRTGTQAEMRGTALAALAATLGLARGSAVARVSLFALHIPLCTFWLAAPHTTKLEGPSSSSAAAARQRPEPRHVSSNGGSGGGPADGLSHQLQHTSSPPPPPQQPESLEAALARHWLTIDRHTIVITAAVSMLNLEGWRGG